MPHHTQPAARKAVSNYLAEPSQKRSFEAALQYARGERFDMAAQLTSDFLKLQSKLLKYRVVRLADEMKYIANHPFGCYPSGRALLVQTVALPMFFVLGQMLGRGSRTPLVNPPPDVPTTETAVN